METTGSTLIQRLLERDTILSLSRDRASSSEEKAFYLGRMRTLAPDLDEALNRYSSSFSTPNFNVQLQAETETLLADFSSMAFVPGVAEALAFVLNILSSQPPTNFDIGPDDTRRFTRFIQGLGSELVRGNPQAFRDRLIHAWPRQRSELWASLLENQLNVLNSVTAPIVAPPVTALLSQSSAGTQPARSARQSTSPPRPRSTAPEFDDDSAATKHQRSSDLQDLVRREISTQIAAIREDLLTRVRERVDGYAVALTDLQKRLHTSETGARGFNDELGALRGEIQTIRAQQQSAQMLLDRIVEQAPKRFAQLDALELKVNGIEQKLQANLPELIFPVIIDIRDKDVDANVAQPVVEAVLDFLRSAGFEVESQDKWEIRTGSFFARLKAGFKVALGKDGIEGKINKVESALTNRFVRLPGSQVSLNEAEATARLVSSLDRIHDAVVAVGPVIMVKRTTQEGRLQMFVVPLSETIRDRMDSDPSCLTSPDAFFGMLRELQETEVRRLQVFEPKEPKKEKP